MSYMTSKKHNLYNSQKQQDVHFVLHLYALLSKVEDG